MSKLGNIQLSYGKQFNIAIANTYSNIILTGSNLPINTIIISSNVDEDMDDTGAYSIIATDNEGNPVRLTYCIKQGNGIINDDNSDILYLNIDNEFIKNDETGLHIDLSNISDGNVNSDNNVLTVNNSRLNIASDSKRGIFSIDNETVLKDDTLYINTDKLNYSNNATSTYGILSSSDNIVKINNGIITIEENNIPKAENNKFGICKCDDNTLYIEKNTVHVNTSNLDKSTENNYGIITVDDNKILSNNGILSVNTNRLNTASNNSKGVIGIDGKSITLNANNQISVNNYSKIINDLNDILNNINDKINSVDEIENNILSQIK